MCSFQQGTAEKLLLATSQQPYIV